MKKPKKLLIFVLALASLICLFVFGASAETVSGMCGSNLTWTYDTETCALDISGTGEMRNYSYSSSTTSSTAPWNGYLESIKTVTISEGVTSIGNYAFSYGSGLIGITIPDSVTSIGDYAFYDCRILTDITIPNGMTSIGEAVFYNCASLLRIIIPDGITSIGKNAFYNCTSLSSVIIPDSVTSIGYYAFGNCTGLTMVNIEDISAWCKIDFNTIASNPLYFAENLYLNNELVTNLTIPDGITTIGDCTFCGGKCLTNITIPDSVTIIGNSAFRGCTGLTSITIPKGVTNINNSVFRYCTGLTNVTIPDGVTSIGDYAFSECTGLTNVTIPKNVISIGKYAFEKCTGLTNIIIPDRVTSIGGFAFNYCKGLTSVTIPNGSTDIGSYAFLNCTSLKKVNISDLSAWCKIYFGNDDANPLSYAHNLYLNNELVTDLIIPDDVTSIGNYVFSGCSIKSITIPENVSSIGNCAFKLSGLNRITILNPECKIHYNTDTISSGVTIYGYAGSTAEAYANNYGKTFVDITCDHLNTVTVNNVSATCTTDGYSGDTYCYDCERIIAKGKTVYALGHNMKTSSAISATCTQNGRTAGTYCTRCDYSLDSYVIPATGHTADVEVTENRIDPTCTTKGSYDVVVYCKVCKEELSRETLSIDKDDHEYNVSYIAPTCTKEGSVTLACSKCDETRVEKIEKIGHNYVDFVIAPTCTSDGYTKHHCVNCGDEYNSDVVLSAGHDFRKETIKPTCTENGCDVIICSICGYNYSANIVRALGHSVVIDYAEAPTCTHSGLTEGSHCSTCGVTINKQETIPSTGHIDENNDGLCDDCGKVMEEHDPSENCTCMCHKTGFMQIIYKIVRIFWKIFGTNKTCNCGVAHY